jgi:hypothetical protein
VHHIQIWLIFYPTTYDMPMLPLTSYTSIQIRLERRYPVYPDIIFKISLSDGLHTRNAAVGTILTVIHKIKNTEQFRFVFLASDIGGCTEMEIDLLGH